MAKKNKKKYGNPAKQKAYEEAKKQAAIDAVERKYTAYHEAGHVIATIHSDNNSKNLEGVIIDNIEETVISDNKDIINNDEIKAYMKLKEGLQGSIGEVCNILLGGAASIFHFFEDKAYKHSGANTDFQMLEDILEDEFNGSIDSVDHISSYFFNNAIPFVKRHENEIKKVAEALIEKGNLTTKEIMEVLK